MMERPVDLKIREDFAKLLRPSVPKAVKMMAARGIMPGASPKDLLNVLYALTFSEDEEISDQADATILQTPENILCGAIDHETHPSLLHMLALARVQDEDLMEYLVLRRQVGDVSLIELARNCPHLKVVEIIAKNHERLLTCPDILGGLRENSVSSQNLIDVTVAFLQMAGVLPVGAEARTEGLPERIDNRLIDTILEDVEFDDTLTDEEADLEESASDEREKSLQQQVHKLGVAAKVVLAYRANRETRSILLRDSNKTVVRAVLNSGKITEGEAVQLTKNRTIDSEVLSAIFSNRDLSKRYEIKVNLASNPKTPQAIAMRLVRELRIHDLKALAKNRNVAVTVSTSARVIASRKKLI